MLKSKLHRSSQEGFLLDLVPRLEASLGALPGLTVDPMRPEDDRPPGSHPLRLRVTAKGRTVELAGEVRRHGYPRDALQAVEPLLGSTRGTDALPFFVAPSISVGARKLLRERGIGYWDESGSLYLDLPGALYVVDRPPRQPDRHVRHVFSGATAQVLHAMLLHPEREWHLHELAALAETSVYTVHQVCEFLEARLWMRKHGAGPRVVRILTEPGALLDAWAENHSLESYRFHRFYHLASSPAALHDAVSGLLGALDIPHAMTLECGAELVAPFATAIPRQAVLVPEERMAAVTRIASARGFRPVEDGENVVFLGTCNRAPLMFIQDVESVPVASLVQLYLDLWAWPRRGREQARHLRALRMGF